MPVKILSDVKHPRTGLSMAPPATPTAMIVANFATGELVEVNSRWLNSTGYSADTLLHKPGVLSLLFSQQGELDKLRSLHREKDRIDNQEYHLTLPNGGRRLINLCAYPFDRDDGDLFLLFFSDVTEARSHDKLSAFYENKIQNLEKALNASSLVSVTDAAGIIIYVNEKFCEISQYARNELLGENHNIINSGYHPKQFMQNLWATIRSGKIWHGEIRNRAKDGTIYWVDSIIVPFVDKNGKPYQYFAIRQDITQRKKNALELERSREALLQAQSLARVGSWEWYPAFDEPVWSPEMYAIFQMNPHGAPVKFADVGRLFAAESFAKLGPLVQNTFDTGQPYQLECEIIRSDASHGWIISSGSPIRADDGTIIGVRGTVQDITDRKLNEERNRLIINAMPDLIFVLSQDGVFVDYHAAEPTRLAYKPEFFMGKSFHSIFDHALAAKMDTALKAVFAGSKVERIEYTLPVSGKDMHFEATFTPLDRNRSMAVVRDITERKKTALLLEEQATLLDKARDAILVRDLDHRIRFWNHGAERIYGHTKAEALDSSVRSLLYTDPSAFDTATAAVLEKGEYTGELEQLTKDGHKITAQVRWTLLRDDEGKPKSILAINTDVTERKKLEQQFLRAQRLESIGTLAGGIAHDLNNVMTPIMLAVAVLRTGNLNTEQLDLLSMIEASVKHGTEMIRQVLSFARGVEGNPRPMSIALLTKELESIIRETFPRNITLTVDLPSDLWQVRADSTQLHQVLMNLAVNARDAMPNGGKLTISAENRTLDEQYAGMQIDAKPGQYVAIRIEDNGSGMPAQVVEKVFEPFFTTKDHGKGTGLGLSTSLAIVKGHGGFMRLYSEPGRGTRFHIYLPALTGSEEIAAQVEAQAMPRGNGELILVVDDEEKVRTVTCQTLEAFGYRTRCAADGAEAIAILAELKDSAALMLTDIMMPVLDGPGAITVALRMKPNLPIIAASGLEANGKLAQFGNDGRVRFLAKPFSADQLLQTVHLALSQKKS